MRLSTLLLGSLSLLALGGWAWDYQTREAARLRLRVIAAQLEPLGQLSYQNLRAHPWGQGSAEQLRLKLSTDGARRLGRPIGSELRIDRVEVSRYRESAAQIPEQLQLRLYGLHWPLAQTATTGAEIVDPAEQPLPNAGELGYRELCVDAELRLQYLLEQRALQMSFALHDPEALALQGRVGLRAGPEIFRGESQTLELSRLQLDYRDLGLLSKLKTLLALRGRVSASGLDQALLARLDRETRQRRLRWRDGDYTVLESFIREPKALRLQLEPPGRLQLRNLALYAEADLPAVLGLELALGPAETPPPSP
jgi:hypothetical protein